VPAHQTQGANTLLGNNMNSVDEKSQATSEDNWNEAMRFITLPSTCSTFLNGSFGLLYEKYWLKLHILSYNLANDFYK